MEAGHAQVGGEVGRRRRTGTVAFPFGPFGPFAPLPAQPLALQLELRGEMIADVTVVDEGCCRRGIVALAENRPVDEALALVERTCALAGGSYRLALCLALEAATQTPVPERASLVRVLFAEVERLLARLWLLGEVARAAGNVPLHAAALEQREELFDALEVATGERVYWRVAALGGVRVDLALGPLEPALERFAPAVEQWRTAASARGALGRAGAGLGVVSDLQAEAWGMRGLLARAAGIAADVRQDAPYAAYRDLEVAWPAEATAGGDAAARVAVAAEELAASAALMSVCLVRLAGMPEARTAERAGRWLAGQQGQAVVEGPHGPVTVGVRLASEGRIAHVVLEPPGGALLGALPTLLVGRTLAQAPLILASLDLCLDCTDL